MEIPRRHRSSDRAGPLTPRDSAASDVAFRLVDGVDTPNRVISRRNSPAYAYPCQRFADTLTSANA
jgi:hypothetical protein